MVFIISFILAGEPIQHIIPFRFPGSFSIQKKANAIRVMDWNVAQFEIMQFKTAPDIKQKMIGLINEYQPDIACFQEMTCDDSVVDTQFGYHLKEFADTLQFPYNYYAYNFREDFVQDIHFGIIIFSKYPIINTKMVSSPPHDYNSIFQYVDIVKDKDTIRIFNIHLQSLKFTPTNLHYLDSPTLKSEVDLKKTKSVLSKLRTGFLKRHLQADRIKAEIDKCPYPFIVCGDFNDVPNSYASKIIGDGLKNAFVEKGHGLGRTFSGIAPTLRIDNIFTDKSFSIQQFIRINKKLSDHFPIIADIARDKDD